jgi:hypothetical protein
MRAKIEEIEEKKSVVVEFPLTQAERAWKIRIDGKISADKILGFQIQEQSFLEWMVDYREIRDILCCYKKVSSEDFHDIFQKFEQITPSAEKPEDVDQGVRVEIGNIIIERQIMTKQRKRTERFPYIFVLFKLLYETISESANIFLVDKNGEKITNTNGRKIQCGDTLIWLPSKVEISNIIEQFAYLSKKHKETAKKEIFDKI